MLKTVFLVSGGGTNLQAVIDAICREEINAEIVKVISSSSKAYALKRAEKAGIATEVITYKKGESRQAFDEALSASVRNSGAELVVFSGFLCILGPEFIRAYKNRIINVHPSLIPSFCGKGFYGLKVHEAALEAGVRITGATVHFVDEGCDTGPIILQKAVCVGECEKPEELQKKVMEEAEWVLLPRAIGLIAEGAVAVKGRKVILREKRI